jgi:epoxyqueuosine reductase
LPLPIDPARDCALRKLRALQDVCPTQAIILRPYRLDARRCITTIEHEGSIDEELRPLIINRILGATTAS